MDEHITDVDEKGNFKKIVVLMQVNNVIPHNFENVAGPTFSETFQD